MRGRTAPTTPCPGGALPMRRRRTGAAVVPCSRSTSVPRGPAGLSRPSTFGPRETVVVRSATWTWEGLSLGVRDSKDRLHTCAGHAHDATLPALACGRAPLAALDGRAITPTEDSDSLWPPTRSIPVFSTGGEGRGVERLRTATPGRTPLKTLTSERETTDKD